MESPAATLTDASRVKDTVAGSEEEIVSWFRIPEHEEDLVESFALT